METTAKYGVWYADPPWHFAVRSPKGKGRSAERHYNTLSLDQIIARGQALQYMASKDCVLFMWAIDPMLDKAMEVVKAWGFTFKTVGFYWVKTSVRIPNPVPSLSSCYPMGTGYWTRANPEQCLLATRGHPKPLFHSERRLIVAPRRLHSQKPEEAYERIERLCAGPYLEL